MTTWFGVDPNGSTPSQVIQQNREEAASRAAAKTLHGGSGVGSPLPVSAALSDAKLHLGARIGAGSSSEVYVAWLERASVMKRVAVKVFGKTPGKLGERIEMAARSMALVRHPNVVDVSESGTLSSGQPFILMEMIDGMSLASFLRVHRAAKRKVPLDLALFIAIEIAEGLAAAHLAKKPDGCMLGLSHLDLSTRSVLLSFHGEAKVEGFGLAAAATDGSGIRVVRSWKSRLETMAPEIANGEEGNARSDVFSLGVLLHEMLVGPRFPARVNDEEACAMAKSGFVCPDLIAPPLPPGIAEIVDRALSCDPHERQRHAGVVAYDLRRIALRMGVADVRMFLRNALFEMSEAVID